MEKLFNTVSIFFGVICGTAAAAFGQWDAGVKALTAVMVMDYMTGIIKAVYQKRMSSEIGYKGILKKIIILVTVALANVIRSITGAEALRETVIMFYIANEAISVLENIAAVSPKMPPEMKNILLQLRDGGDS